MIIAPDSLPRLSGAFQVINIFRKILLNAVDSLRIFVS